MTLPEPAAPLFSSIASLMERSASANRENGEFSADQIGSWSRKIVLELEPPPNPGPAAARRASLRVWLLPASTIGTTEMHAVCNTLSTCERLQKEPFIKSRSVPTATPKTKPPAAANTRTKAVLGLL